MPLVVIFDSKSPKKLHVVFCEKKKTQQKLLDLPIGISILTNSFLIFERFPHIILIVPSCITVSENVLRVAQLFIIWH